MAFQQLSALWHSLHLKTVRDERFVARVHPPDAIFRWSTSKHFVSAEDQQAEVQVGKGASNSVR